MASPKYIENTLAQVRAIEGTTVQYPFLSDGDTDTKVYSMVCSQLATDYQTTQVALDTPMTSASNAGVIELPFDPDPDAYFVGDTGHTPTTGGMLQFTRTFSHVPKTITVPSGSQLVSFPGIDTGYLGIVSMEKQFQVDGIIFEFYRKHGVGVGDQLQVVPGGAVSWIAYYPSPIPGGGEYDSMSSGGKYTVTEVFDDFKLRLDVPTAYPYNVDLAYRGGDLKNIDTINHVITDVSMASGGRGIVLRTQTEHQIDAGQRFDVNVSFTVGDDPHVINVNGEYEALSGDGFLFTIDPGYYWPQQQTINIVGLGRIFSLGVSRRQTQYNVQTHTRYEYILPGITPGVDSIEDVNIPSAFKVISALTGEISTRVTNTKWEYLNVGISFSRIDGTLPDRNDYVSMVDRKANIVLESSLTEWAGNIFLLKTKTCKAL